MTTPTESPKEAPLAVYMRQPDQLEKFMAVLGGKQEAQAYIQSVLIEATSDEKLRECTPQSVCKAALRAATLGLSCDKSLKQAWLVPYNRNIAKKGEPKKWIKEAQFQPHYLGLRTLAMRTNKYWTINVSPVYDGQRVLYNPLTGLHVVQESNGFQGEPKAYNPGLVDVTSRRAKDMKVIGWIAYYKAKNGEEKSVYMSCVEIDDWARMYVRDYEDNQNWNDQNKRPTMEMKTVLRRLLDWTDKSGKEGEKLAAALKADTPEDQDIVDAPAEDVPESEQDLRPMNIDEARQVVGVINGKEKQLGNCLADELNWLYVNSIKSTVVEAAKIILKEDFRMDPPQVEKKSVEQLQKELGF